MSDDHPVAVVGVGVVCPGARNAEEFWNAHCSATSAVGPIDGFERHLCHVHFAAQVRDFDPKTRLRHQEVRRTDLATQFGVCAALEAVDQAGPGFVEPARTAVVGGTALGGTVRIAASQHHLLTTGRTLMQANPLSVAIGMPNAAAAFLSLKLGITGPTTTVSLACASGTAAIGDAARLIRHGYADKALAGGHEAPVHPWLVAAFARMAALSTRSDDPAGASRPFDADRDGFVMGEGGGYLALERADIARDRGATVLALIGGSSQTSDAHHLVAPQADGSGAAEAMRLALADAGISAGDIGHVNAHGTSTPLNDQSEAAAIRLVFGDEPPPITSTKGMIGHLIGGAGGVEAVATVLAVHNSTVPPTANYATEDPDIALDVVAESPRPVGSKAALSNSFAFGGHNASLVVTPA